MKIDHNEVLKKLNKLKISKSPGPDSVHPRTLKEIAAIICKPMAMIFQRSLDSGKLPHDWKLSNITAIYKKGSKKVAGNYRPVSLTSIACKVLESLIRDHVINFMKSNKLFTNKQFGFLGGRSTVLQLLILLDQLTEILDGGGAIDIIYFDFAKAFDRVPHHRLMLKLASYGISGNVYDWIKSFLSGRMQRVVVNGCFSEWLGVTSGVPQGSVLGPLLFVIFINDLPDVVGDESIMYLFADDAKLGHEIACLDDTLYVQNDVNSMKAWGKKWLMEYHPQKCKVLQLGKNPLKGQYAYKLDGHELEFVSSEKDLGVTFDDQLSFDQHMSQKISKANQILGVIRRTFQHLDRESFLMLYKSLVRPQIEYANQVWAPKLKRQINSIENVQRRATRMIPGLKDLPYEERLRTLKLPSLSYRRLRGDLIEMFKIVKPVEAGGYDKDVCEGFLKLKPRDTRGHTFMLSRKHTRLMLRERAFPHKCRDAWNSLSQHVVDANNVKTFESRLDKFLSNQKMIYDYEAEFCIADTGSTSATDCDLMPEAS